MIEVKLAERLKTVAQNVYFLAAPTKYGVPAVIFNRLSTQPINDVGENLQETAYVVFQIDVYDTDAISAAVLTKTIKQNLQAWQDPDVQTVAFTAHENFVDNTTDVRLFRSMTIYRMFVLND